MLLNLMCWLNLLLTECDDFLGCFALHLEQAYVLFGPRQSSITFPLSVFNSVEPVLYFKGHALFNENDPDEG